MQKKLFGKFNYALDLKSNLLIWRVSSELSLLEVKEIIDELKKVIEELPTGKLKVLVDNRYMVDKNEYEIVFPNAINQEWIMFQKWLIDYSFRIAVLCGTLIMQAQMERLGEASGLNGITKLFYNKDSEEILRKSSRFLEIEHCKVVEIVEELGF